MKIKNISMIMLSILAFNTIAEETQKTFIFNIPNSSKSFLVEQSNTEEPEQWIQIEDKIVKSPIYPLSSVTVPFGALNHLNYPNSGIYPVNITYTANMRYYTIKQERNNKSNEIREYPPIETFVTETNTFPTTYNIEYLTEYQFDSSRSYYGDKVYDNNVRDENGNIKTTQSYTKVFTRTANIDRLSDPRPLRNNLNARIVQNNTTLQRTETETISDFIPNTSGWNCNYSESYSVRHEFISFDYKDPNQQDSYAEFLSVYYGSIGFNFIGRNVFSESEFMTDNDILNLVIPFEGKQYKAINIDIQHIINNTQQETESFISTTNKKQYTVCQSI